MGKKRGRSAPQGSGGDAVGETAPLHTQSLVDEVREVRDIEFAAEKRQADRAKRRKLAEERQVAEAKKHARAMKKANKLGNANVARVMDAKRAGLEMWRRAALRRKNRSNDPQGDDVAVDGDLNDGLHTNAIDRRTTAKIFQQAKEQRAEIREENIKALAEESAKRNAAVDEDLEGVGELSKGNVANLADTDDESEDDNRSHPHTDIGYDSVAGDHEKDLDFLDATKITEEEELALAMFSNAGHSNQGEALSAAEGHEDAGPRRVMLADIILDKIREKEEADARAAAAAADPEKAERDKKIAEVYGLVGNIMSKYRSGKVPKAFKVIPKQGNWEDLLYLTRPDEWSPAAVYVATRLFASNLPAKEVVRFYTDVLLPRCLEDISDNKKLNYHLYRALGKAVYKPDAFCKGILFPLCEDRSTTLRQATIIGSVVSKVSIPMLHSAAALLYICQLSYSPSNSIVMTALVEKKYALPYRVLDAVVDSFLNMKTDPRRLPLLWHQCLLSFAQRFKMELTMEQKEQLKFLMRVHSHHAVTPEIRRELFSARNRGDIMEPDANTVARNIAGASMVC